MEMLSDFSKAILTNKVTYSNNPIETAKKWEVAGADMLHVVDLDAALSTDKNNIEIISNLIKAVNIPVEVAGGIRSINAIHEMFSKNASKVVTRHHGLQGTGINKTDY